MDHTVSLENLNQLVTFTMDNEEFSFPINSVQEIVRLPEVTPVPGAPDAVKGIMNLRGAILPLIDLRRYFELETAAYGEDSRVVVIRHQEYATGMIVDRVNEVLHVEEEEVEPPPPAVESSRANWLQGIARLDSGRRVIMILAEDRILPDAPEDSQELAARNRSEDEVQQETVMEDEKLLVSFRLGEEEFAVNITEVREIVRLAEITHLPHVPDFVLGVMSLRNSLLPVLDLRRRFGMEAVEENELAESEDDETDARRIIVADIGGVVTGLMVDAVSEVLRLPEKEVEAPPEVIDPDNAQYIQGVGQLDDGKRLLLLLDIPKLLSGKERESMTAATGGNLQEKGETHMAQDKDMGAERQLVCFRIMDEEYGLDIMQVREIIRIDTITAVPGAPSYVSGIVNLRGNVLPVIDLRLRFGRDSVSRSEQNRILVVEMDGKITGLIVDAVSEVLRVPENNIEQAPHILKTGSASQYITGIAKLSNGDRTIILVNTDTILDLEEMKALYSVDAIDGSHAPVEKEEISVSDVSQEDTSDKEDEVAELVTDAVESAEAKDENSTSIQDSAMQAQKLMALKKAELIDKAKEMGLDVDPKKTKKQIVEIILENN